MKTTSRLAIATAFAAFASTGAMAADLGGNCCSDLEERVAELEATTARKGNRRVSLEVSGHVHEAIVFFDVDTSVPGSNANESNIYIGTHNSSRSRFRFKGTGKINSDWSAGYLIEIGVRRNSLVGTSQNDARVGGILDIRHEALFVKSKQYGTVWLGHTSSAADGITEICVGCGLGNSADFSDDLNGLLDGNGVRIRNLGATRGVFAGEGDRREMIRYISPELSGFVISAAAGGDDFWDVALRYANEFNGVRVAAGIGYQESSQIDDAGGLTCGGAVGNNPDVECSALGLSASAQHVASGFYVYGAYGYDDDQSPVNRGQDESWQVSVGVNRKFSPIGGTNIFAMYGESDREINLNSDLEWFGVGIEQKVDAAAMRFYVWYKHFEYETVGAPDGEVDVLTLGARIRF